MLAYVMDTALRKRLNARRMNYWDVYIAEIFEMLGLRGRALGLADLENKQTLDRLETLVVGAGAGAELPEPARLNLLRWVRAGGTLIGFAVKRMDEAFGIEPAVRETAYAPSYVAAAAIPQGADDWAINGYFNFRAHPITREVHHLLFLEQKLPIVSDIAPVRLNGAQELATLFDTTGKALGFPAITWHACGRGQAGYFAFDVAKTVWLLHQGRPAPDHPESGNYPRAHDMSIVGTNSRLVPYADEMCWLIQNMIAAKPQPFIDPLPPAGGQPAAALLYYGGDEYTGPTELSIEAARFMHGLGLPYQTNIESDNHPMTKAEHALIRSLGTEVSAYYHLYEKDGFRMRPEHYRRQSDRFFKRFGYRPVVTVNHCLRWQGWTEPAKWMRAAGTRADNGFAGKCVPNDNHFRNSASFGFGFGTAYPFYFWDDWRARNARIDFMEQPIVCYEAGHRGSTAVEPDRDTRAFEDLHLALSLALKYHLTLNMFYHPTYIVRNAACREALYEIRRYLAFRRAVVVHMNNRMLAEWWDARHASAVAVCALSRRQTTFRARCAYPAGMVVKLPLPQGCEGACVEGTSAVTVRREFGRTWIYLVVPRGRHRLTVRFAD